MGTDALIVCVGRDADTWCEMGRTQVAELEHRWTRFDRSSELSALNAAAGTGPFPLSSPTFELVAAALEAWRCTSGYFDPTVGAAVVAAGYDRSYEQVCRVRPPPSGEPAPGPVGIELDPERRTVTLPAGVAIDLGGIGKGRAADLTARRLLDLGAEGACVDLGGDLALAGRPPDGEAWTIGVDEWGHASTPDVEELGEPGGPDGRGRMLRVARGAVATSSTAGRRWRTSAGPAHHLIDPATGRPSTSGVRTVTVLAAEAMWAEVVAKAVLIAGPDRGLELLCASGACGFLVDDDGRRQTTADLPGFVA